MEVNNDDAAVGCHHIGSRPGTSEYSRQIAGTVEDASNFNAGVGREIKDEVVADAVAAEVNRKLGTRPALLRSGGQPVAVGAKLVDELVGGIRIVARDVEPDLGEVGFASSVMRACFNGRGSAWRVARRRGACAPAP